MYYHATNKKGLRELKPFVSNHKEAYCYFSDKRENILIYLSNPIKKFCEETNKYTQDKYNWFIHYGFVINGKLVYFEYCENLLYDTYYGVSGYIYYVESDEGMETLPQIRNVFINKNRVKPIKVEYIEDAYSEILKEKEKGNIAIIWYKDLTEEQKKNIKKLVLDDYNNNPNDLATRYYYEEHFDFVKTQKKKVIVK